MRLAASSMNDAASLSAILHCTPMRRRPHSRLMEAKPSVVSMSAKARSGNYNNRKCCDTVETGLFNTAAKSHTQHASTPKMCRIACRVGCPNALCRFAASTFVRPPRGRWLFRCPPQALFLRGPALRGLSPPSPSTRQSHLDNRLLESMSDRTWIRAIDCQGMFRASRFGATRTSPYLVGDVPRDEGSLGDRRSSRQSSRRSSRQGFRRSTDHGLASVGLGSSSAQYSGRRMRAISGSSRGSCRMVARAGSCEAVVQSVSRKRMD